MTTAIFALPTGWQTRPLGDLGRVVRGGSPRPAGDPRYFDGSFIPWLTVASLTAIPASQIRVNETAGCLTEEGAKRSRTLLPNTLVLANSGATLGVAKILDLQCCANDGIAALIDQHAGNREFICQYLNTRTDYLRDVVAPGNGQPNLNTTLIKAIEVPFPPEPEQERIAQVLGDADDLITKVVRLIAKKRDIKHGMMQELLTGSTRLPGFTGDWGEVELGELGGFFKGRGINRDQTRSSGVPCIRYGELYTAYHNYARETVSFVDPDVAMSALPIRAGDLLFAGSGETKAEIGMTVAYVGEPAAVAGGDIIVLRGTGFDPIFVASLLNTPSLAAQKASRGQGDAVVHISAGALSALRFPLPDIDEQRAIAEVLQVADAEIEALERGLDSARAVKVGMMQELLTGRTRLPVKEEA
ncbi:MULTISPECIES: restriction endonuclease subunit S [Arthrobacter]|uniref:Restriction endonuclease subunit S n=1 Tax=Arthrobacter terricola TaxID=2547396 RepID=A0A4V2ZRZ8_9MICC|nr:MULTISPECIES: restriction endonuclease subunit S [Arthrobacter]MBT8163155.1 restriction endonuclease subunit S [Arthrobacter sp. GN70]TDF91274.1 restriction endonuclease subunit S [Arthrobacter terricola]